MIYLRAIHSSGEINCNVIATKSRVAPLKKDSIPRLELAATEILSELFGLVQTTMELQKVPYYLWSDNTSGFQWIQKPLHELKLFIANRVRKICKVSQPID